MAKPSAEREVDRYVGLSLGGAKSDRTCLAIIDYYRKQEKSFVVDVFENIASEKGSHGEELTSDQVLLELIEEHQPGIDVLATDAPLTLPPCLESCDSHCTGYDKCKRPEVRWMKHQYQLAKRRNKKLKHFTPYSQRPVDLYFRYQHPDHELFQDETLGANMAPQAARMQYLKRRLDHIELVEVWPKLVLYFIHKSLKLGKREIACYRHLEKGLHTRERILESLAERAELFVYDRDFKKITSSVAAFESLLCAWVALQYRLERVMKFKSDIPLETGWIQVPEL